MVQALEPLLQFPNFKILVMKRKYCYLIGIFLKSLFLVAQVGINNPNPQAALDVIGNVIVRENLFLEDPGASDEIRGSKLLIQKTDSEIVKYDLEKSKYGPINYAQFIFQNTNTNGLYNYDTKISASEYIVTVQGFYFLIAGTTNTNVTVESTVDNNFIEGFQFYAYIDESTKTWHIKGFVNNSTFQLNGVNKSIDLYVNLIIFRNGFIAKPLDAIIVDMGDNETLTIAAPSGF